MKLTRRRVILAASVLILCLGGLLLAAYRSTGQFKFEQVRTGMTMSEVESILGTSHQEFIKDWAYYWDFSDGQVWVRFDSENRVISKDFRAGDQGWLRAWLADIRFRLGV